MSAGTSSQFVYMSTREERKTTTEVHAIFIQVQEIGVDWAKIEGKVSEYEFDPCSETRIFLNKRIFFFPIGPCLALVFQVPKCICIDLVLIFDELLGHSTRGMVRDVAVPAK
jgi:hypothetical protein